MSMQWHLPDPGCVDVSLIPHQGDALTSWDALDIEGMWQEGPGAQSLDELLGPCYQQVDAASEGVWEAFLSLLAGLALDSTPRGLHLAAFEEPCREPCEASGQVAGTSTAPSTASLLLLRTAGGSGSSARSGASLCPPSQQGSEASVCEQVQARANTVSSPAHLPEPVRLAGTGSNRQPAHARALDGCSRAPPATTQPAVRLCPAMRAAQAGAAAACGAGSSCVAAAPEGLRPAAGTVGPVRAASRAARLDARCDAGASVCCTELASLLN